MSFASALYRGLSRMTGGLFGWLDEDYQHTSYMTAQQALSYAPVWSCVSRISGAFTIMPLNILRKRGRDIQPQPNHPSYQLMRWSPNAFQTPSVWKRQQICHALLWGNGRSYIVRDENTGRPIELIPMMPDRTTTFIAEGRKYHGVSLSVDDPKPFWDAFKENPHSVFVSPDEDVLHIMGLGTDGVQGLSLLQLAAQSWSVGKGGETHAAKQQKKGYAGGLMLEAPAGAFRKEEDAREFLKAFNDHHAGADNAGKIGMLRDGIKANVLAMNNTDAQFIEQRRFQREDAALWFVLQGIIGDNSNSSYNSNESKNLAYRIDCLAPWCTTIEEQCDVKLLNKREQRLEFYHKFNDGALLRTEKSATMAFISQGITARVLSPNEGRAMLDMNPYEGGDVYENPATLSKQSQNNNADNEESEQQEENPAQTAAAQARIKHLIGVEAGKVRDAAHQAAKKSKNFVAWLDDFYTNRWSDKLAAAFVEIGVDPVFALEHCERSKQRILSVLGESTMENLEINVEKAVSAWQLRSAQIGRDYVQS
jgi:HK97 family phage portal protein